MLGELFKRLFVRSSPNRRFDEEVIMQFVPSNTPLDVLPAGRMLCIFRRGLPVNHYRDEIPSERERDERWYLIASSDLTVKPQIEIGKDILEVQTRVRLEPESELLSLIGQGDVLTHADVTALVASQLSGLVDDLGCQAAEAFEGLPDEEREKTRARLSLLLQTRGIRCTGIENIRVLETSQTSAEAAGPEGESTSQVAEIDESTLTHAISEISTPDDWEDIVSTLDAEGCEFNAETAQQVQALGEQVVSKRLPAASAVAQLRQLADQARESLMPKADRMYMRGLDIRLASLHWMQEADEVDLTPIEGPRLKVRRRPWTWWMFSRRKVDDRLQSYLRETLGGIRASFDSARSGGSFQPYFVDLRRIDQRLGICLDQLATTPSLTPAMHKLRLDRRQIKTALQGVERAVRAAETVAAESKQLQSVESSSDAWKLSCQTICDQLDQLSQELNQRRQLHA